MPDFGLSKALTKAVGKAVRKGSRAAKVQRPGELAAQAGELAAQAAERKAAEAASEAAARATAGTAEQNIPAPEAPEFTVSGESSGLPAAPAIADESVPAPAAAAEGPASDAGLTRLDDVQPTTVVPPPGSPKPAAKPLLPPLADDLALPGQAEIDAARVSKANLGDYALDDASMPNFDRITTTDDIKAVIAQTAQKNATRIDEAKRGVITNQQLLGLAADLDLSEDVVRKVVQRESGGILNAETILAARQVLNSSADRLKQLADLVATGKANDFDKIKFARQVQFHNEYQTQFMGARAEAGRALNAFKIPVGSDATVVARIGEILASNGANIEELARVVRTANSTSGITKAVKAGLFSRSGSATMGFINRVFINGILSGPPTHIVNITGNAMFQAMTTFELAAAARLGKFLPGAEHVEVGEALASLTGTLNATRDAYRLAWKALKSGESIDNMLKFDAGMTGKKTLDIVPELGKPFIGRVVSVIDEIIDAPTRVLGAEDELFKTFAYRADLDRQAFVRALEQARGGELGSVEEAYGRTIEFLEKTPEQSMKSAEDWAREVTFQSPLGPVGQKAQLFLRSVPVLTLIAPFIRTPINVFKQAAYRSPLALFSARFWKDVGKGGRARDIALTRFAIGSATSAMVAKWVTEDKVTGAGPQNPQAKMIWEASGKRPYSFKTEDSEGNVTWQSYARIEPIASVIGATADATEILAFLNDDVETLSDEEQQAYNAVGAVIAGVMNNTGNKTFMKGIADFSEFVSDPKRQIKPFTNQLGASLVPYSAMSRFIRNTQDPYLREAFTLIDKIKDNTPGLSENLPARLDLFGQTRVKKSGALLGVMSPLPDSKETNDPVYAELEDLMERTRLVPLTMPGKEVEGMRLNGREFSELVRIARAEPVAEGKTFKDVLQETIDTPEYQSATGVVRVEIIKRLQSQFDNIGRALLEQEDPEFAERITTWRLKKERLKFEE